MHRFSSSWLLLSSSLFNRIAKGFCIILPSAMQIKVQLHRVWLIKQYALPRTHNSRLTDWLIECAFGKHPINSLCPQVVNCTWDVGFGFHAVVDGDDEDDAGDKQTHSIIFSQSVTFPTLFTANAIDMVIEYTREEWHGAKVRQQCTIHPRNAFHIKILVNYLDHTC